jgi:putative DeoR family transcriptional regulator (stage III sporulation protein D)
MHDFIEERVRAVAEYILKSKATVRETSKEFMTSKSTVHKDIKRLKEINPLIYHEVCKVMQEHTAVRHIHGGESTRRRWILQKQN